METIKNTGEDLLEHVVLISEVFKNDDGTECTVGSLYLKNKETNQMEFFCKTIERPWLNNKPFVSCIPAGRYKVTWNYSPNFKRDMYILLKTEPRTGIRIHSANKAEELLGCIALGEKISKVDGKAFLSTSAVTVKRFEEKMNYKDFYITIEGNHRKLEDLSND